MFHSTEVLEQSLRCGICCNTLQDPVIICSNGHSSCHVCINSWITTNRVDCPFCRIPILSTLIPSLAAKEFIQTFSCKCKCGWNGTLTAFGAHSNQCRFSKLVNCPYKKCTDKVCQVDLYKHKLSCPHRPVDHLPKALDCNEIPLKLLHQDRSVTLQEDDPEIRGICYEHGIVFPRDEEKAYVSYNEAVKTGNFKALHKVAICLWNGIGVLKDQSRAIELFTKLAEKGDADAQFRVGYWYYTGKFRNDNLALRWLSLSADQGVAAAQHFLGLCHRYGRGVPKNPNISLLWLTKAANQGYLASNCLLGQGMEARVKLLRKLAEEGDVSAQSALGIMYYEGHGIPKDYQCAVEMFEQAALQYNSTALCYLGICYYEGKGVQKDGAKAVNYLKQALNKPLAQLYLAKCYFSAFGVQLDLHYAFKMFLEAATHKIAEAEYYVGYCYMCGYGVSQDFEVARIWLKRAVNQGKKEALQCLGTCCLRISEEKQAAQYFLASAELGDSNSQADLGMCFFKGTGVQVDYNSSFKWFQKSAEQNNPWGMYNLSICFLYGIGTKMDNDLGIQWLKESAKQKCTAAQNLLESLYQTKIVESESSKRRETQ